MKMEGCYILSIVIPLHVFCLLVLLHYVIHVLANQKLSVLCAALLSL